MNIYILGLRRSGTTIFWETLRQDPRFTAYDEPFNPLLAELPEQNEKRTRDELIKVYERSPECWKRTFEPILIGQEGSETLSEKQLQYLRFLCDHSPNNIFDFTRCNFKVGTLMKNDPSAVIVHLVRDPAGFVTSHLRPTEKGGDGARNWLGNLVRRRFFWQLKGRFDGYSMETIFKFLAYGEGSVAYAFQERFEGVKWRRAVQKLLALWEFSRGYVDSTGLACSPDRFCSVYFPDFLKEPNVCLERIYRKADMQTVDLDFSHLRNARAPVAMGDRRWVEFAEELNIERRLFEYDNR